MNAKVLLVGMLAVVIPSYRADAQPAVPVMEVVPPVARTARTFGTILSVTPMANDALMVNDATHQQLTILDAQLSNARVVIDSVGNGTSGYSYRAVPLVRYASDSLLFLDLLSQTFTVIDPNGRIAHSIALPRASDLGLLLDASSAAYGNSNLYYRGRPPFAKTNGKPKESTAYLDSAPLFRANFETRVVDTIARVKVLPMWSMRAVADANGARHRAVLINPLVAVDEWTVLSDGTVAIVHGGDYHVEWITPSGQKSSTEKLPYDWKRVSDEAKLALMDSAKKAEIKKDELEQAKAVQRRAEGSAGVEAAAATRAAGSSASSTSPPAPDRLYVPQAPSPLTVEFPPLEEIADYYPAIRPGAAKADWDGNLWILPTTSAQSKSGELVYDVVNQKQGLYKRVRMPVGRSIAGFGKNGVIYLMGRNSDSTWYLEKTRIK